MKRLPTLRFELFTFLCFACLVGSAIKAPRADAAEMVRIKTMPPIAKDFEALPRLVTGARPKIIAKINNELARADAAARQERVECLREDYGFWERGVSTKMQGPRYLSLLVSNFVNCGGAHPNNDRSVQVFDLHNGKRPDWVKLLPGLDLHAKIESGGGDTRTAIRSEKLTQVYRDGWKRVHGDDPECAEEINSTELSFNLWPDAKEGGVVADPTSLRHAMQACGDDVTIDLDKLKSLGADPQLLKALDAAHRKSRKE
ncbi:MAG: hypothetical protein ACLPID_11190 [Beijerinckiaceae bacterium]